MYKSISDCSRDQFQTCGLEVTAHLVKWAKNFDPQSFDIQVIKSKNLFLQKFNFQPIIEGVKSLRSGSWGFSTFEVIKKWVLDIRFLYLMLVVNQLILVVKPSIGSKELT